MSVQCKMYEIVQFIFKKHRCICKYYYLYVFFVCTSKSDSKSDAT